MRAITATALASLLAVSLAASPASANPQWRGNHYHGSWGGPALVFGLAGAAIVAGAAADSHCVRYEPSYDDWGNYIGRRAVNVC